MQSIFQPQLVFPRMKPSVPPVGNMLQNVVPEMAALAKSGRIFARVVFRVPVQVRRGEDNAGKTVVAEARPGHICGGFPTVRFPHF